MAELTFSELQRQMQLDKERKQGVSYAFRNAEQIYTKFKKIDSGWELEFKDDDIIERMGRLFYKAVAYVKKGDEVHQAPGYAELSEVPIINTKTGKTIQQMQVPQWTGLVSSYARKYALQGLFAIGEEDVDDYPVEENQEQGQYNQQQQPNNQQAQQQNQISYVDNNQYNQILNGIKQLSNITGKAFDELVDNITKHYQIQDFHQVPVEHFETVMNYLQASMAKAQGMNDFNNL
ncbi:ERF family protein [Streptococcus agalactiae]|uniref:ERF family protein n=1 Tax=Streptococcus agalactiae TaxID=1311 RepID=UPI00030070FB|nr:ERF family protein [Streptococcus agalactiae]